MGQRSATWDGQLRSGRLGSLPVGPRVRLGWAPILVLVCVLLLGCGGVARVPLPKGEMARLGREPVIESVTYTGPGFVVASWDFPPSEQVRRGSLIETKYGLVDPAPRLQGRLVELLGSSLGLKNVRRIESTPASDDPAELRKLLGQVVILDLKTTGWGLTPPERRRSPLGPYALFVAYFARARLLDLGTLAILWQGQCRSRGDEMSPYALSAQGEPRLLANNAELLKRELEVAADRCATDLLGQLSEVPGA